MEHGPLTLGMEDETIDVERLLVEPQAGHLSIDSVCCLDEKISENAVVMDEISCSFDRSSNCIGQRGKDILGGKALDVIPSELDLGYFQSQNELCAMGEEFLLGAAFSESITNLDYGSILQTSVSDCSMLASPVNIDNPWKSDQSRIMDAHECQNNWVNMHRSNFGNIPSHHEHKELTEKSLKSSSLVNSPSIGNFYDFSSCSFQDILADDVDGSLSPLDETDSSSKTDKDKVYETRNLDAESEIYERNDSLPLKSTQASCNETFTIQKRSRKPTQRYIDEIVDPVSRYSKKRRDVSSSINKDKCVVVQINKKCPMESRGMKISAEETSIVAIQVPFGSIVKKECPKSEPDDMEDNGKCESLRSKSTDNHIIPQNKKSVEECITAIHVKRREGCGSEEGQKKRNGSINGHFKERVEYITAASQKKRDHCNNGTSPKKWDNDVTSQNQKSDRSITPLHRKKNVVCLTPDSREEDGGRRKHHRLWTISEVRKLIDGVSQYGVGSWSRIKKLYFSTSAHRTSVDLKDKWRNLLKASGIHEQSNSRGEKRRNVAWRPLPKSILHRVCELAAMYPYPKGRKPKKSLLDPHDSPDKSTDITLSNYRRILRSINGN